MPSYNARGCFSIGATFSQDEFDAVDARAQEYAGGAALTNDHYIAAASDVMAETQAILDKIMTAAEEQNPPQVEEAQEATAVEAEEVAEVEEVAAAQEEPDIRQARSTQPASVVDALSLTSTGKINYGLVDSLARGNFAAAFHAAKDAAERKGAMRVLGDTLIETFADAMIPVRRWIQGLPVDAQLAQRMEGDLYRASTIRSFMEKQVTSQFTDPMYRAIEKAAKESKLTTDEVKKLAGLWMSAKYAAKANTHLITKDRAALRTAVASGDQAAITKATDELNQRIADVNGAVGQIKLRGVAGGFNNAEAAQLLTNVESKLSRQLLDAIAKPVYDMLAWKKAQDIATGKVTQTMVNSWANEPDYVPLTGDPRHSGDDADVFATGNQLNQDKEHAMNGRKDSIADDGIDAALTAVIKSINHAGFQDFKRSLNEAYEQAQATGQDIGLERTALKGMTRMGDDVVVYRDSTTNAMGQQSSVTYSFKFKDQAVIGALKRDNQEHLNAFFKALAFGTSVYGRLVTQFMPMFAPINFIRDIWERTETMRTKVLLDANGNKIDLDKAARESLAQAVNPQLWKATFSKNFKNGQMTAVRGDLEEMMRLGGLSSYGDYLSRSGFDLEADIRASIGPAARGVTAVKDKVESYNNVFEMIPPLAIYRSLKAQGANPKDAAAFTLDLMNFRKRGAVMPAIRAMYVFAQPAAQSGYNLAQYLSTSKGRTRFAAQVLVGGALYAFLAFMWGDDDDEEVGNKLDNLSNFTVERTIPIKFGDQMVKIPIGFGPPQLAWATSGILNRLYSGRYDAQTAAGEAAKAWVKTFSPVSPSDMEVTKRPIDWLAQTVVPTVMRPLYNIASNQTSFGSPLTPQFLNPKKMKFEQAKRNTPEVYSDIAKEIYDMTGVDLYPDHIKAMSDGYLIGPFREVMAMLVDNPAKQSRGEVERMPLINSIVENINDRQLLTTVYYRVRDDLLSANKQFEYLKREDPSAITPELRQQAKAFKEFEVSERMLAQQRTTLKKLKLDDETRDERRIAIEERADAAQRRVLVKFLQAQE